MAAEGLSVALFMTKPTWVSKYTELVNRCRSKVERSHFRDFIILIPWGNRQHTGPD